MTDNAEQARIFSEIVEALDSKTAKAIPQKAESYQAKVSRVDSDGTTWVILPGGDEELAVTTMTAKADPGDVVTVSFEGNALVANGNVSYPSTDDRTALSALASAEDAKKAADSAEYDASRAYSAANEASSAAASAKSALRSVVSGATTVEKAVSVMQTALEAVVDYDPTTDTTQEWFWHDANGAHVLGDTSGYRNDVKSTGMDIVEVASEKSVALFGADGARIGKEYDSAATDNESHLELDYHSMQMIDKEGDSYFHVSDLRDDTGYATIRETFRGDGETSIFGVWFYIRSAETSSVTVDGVAVPFMCVGVDFMFPTPPADGAAIVIEYQTDNSDTKAYTLGTRLGNIGPYSYSEGIRNVSSSIASHAEGSGTVASGGYAHAEGGETTASGKNSHAEGYGTTASGDYSSHAEGWETTSSGTATHSEGGNTVASGDYAHAEGNSSHAEGDYSHAEGEGAATYERAAHAEGYGTSASGYASHAEGGSTTASGEDSHAEGGSTTASGIRSHAEGDETDATGDYSHSEGSMSVASGDYSHAQNQSTVAASDGQTALGKFNVPDANDTYAVIVGNGTADNARSNAFALDWTGSGEFAGDISAVDGVFSGSLTASGGGTLHDPDFPSSAPSSNYWGETGGSVLTFEDADDAVIGRLQGYLNTGGYRGVEYKAARVVGSSTVNNGMRLGVDGSGNREVYFHAPEAWRDALAYPAMTAKASSSQSLTTSYAKVTLAALTTRGSGLSISSGGIACARAGYVEVSAKVEVDGANSGNVFNARVLNGSTAVTMSTTRVTNGRGQVVIPPVVVQVSAGDVLYLQTCNSSSAVGSTSSDNNKTYMTVKYI